MRPAERTDKRVAVETLLLNLDYQKACRRGQKHERRDLFIGELNAHSEKGSQGLCGDELTSNSNSRPNSRSARLKNPRILSCP